MLLAFYSNNLKTAHTLQMTATYAQIHSTIQTSQYHMQRSLRHFTEQLVGACSSMKKNEERKQYDMPIHTRIQDRPMVIPYSPQIKQTKHGFINKMSHHVFKIQHSDWLSWKSQTHNTAQQKYLCYEKINLYLPTKKFKETQKFVNFISLHQS